MDASSPLAAMHPTAAPSWGHKDMFTSHPHAQLTAGNPFGSGTLNIREQLQRTRPDYFSMKSVQGSSPAASLAADLSQNFRIDNEASPRFPTPRRALFTSNMFGAIENREYVTTPPLPASSPGPNEMMDISPLPAQKESFCPTQIAITTPTPLASPDDDDMLVESPIPMSRPSSLNLEPPRAFPVDRRKAGLRRPSLSRAKGYSTSAMIPRLHPDHQMSSFRFGLESRSTGMPLSECFQDSPPQERRPQTANSPTATGPGTFRPKPQFASLSGMREVRNGSPITAHSRRPSNPFMRPRKQYRRSLSMFENPGDVVKAKADEPVVQSTLQSVMDVEEPQDPVLPHFFPEGQNDSIPRISRDTFLEVLDGKFNEQYSQKVVIDCRFEYEYEGGHINGAVNYNDKDLLARHLFQTPMEGKTLLIFHCEYSAHRAPMMARHVRAEDRMANAELYPRLTYPEVYILDGGYSEFFNQHRDRCYPQAYVEMDAEEHAFTCERKLGQLQQKRKGLSRAKTFAFGARESMVDSSPTAGMCSSQHSPYLGLADSPIPGNARRMASY